jgi:sec-independent protein translocase protein TatA
MFDLSPIQILIVLVIALLVFGPKRLPEMGRSVGRGLREFKSAMLDDERPPAPAPRAAASVQEPPAAATSPGPVAAAASSAEDDDDVLEGVVVSGDSQPGRPA